jgi:serine/threonine-protein kinase
VVGLSREEARRRLDSAGLMIGSREEASSDDVAAGKVIEQDPAAGTKVDRGTAVAVVVSTGPPRETAPRAADSASSTARMPCRSL